MLKCKKMKFRNAGYADILNTFDITNIRTLLVVVVVVHGQEHRQLESRNCRLTRSWILSSIDNIDGFPRNILYRCI
jgi:hypothetical protein